MMRMRAVLNMLIFLIFLNTRRRRASVSRLSDTVKYVFIQNDPFLLPKVLDKYFREFADSTAGVNI